MPGATSPGRSVDRQHLDGFIWCSVRQGYCDSDLDFAGIIDQAAENVSHLVLTNPIPVLSLHCSLIEMIITFDQGTTADSLSIEGVSVIVL